MRAVSNRAFVSEPEFESSISQKDVEVYVV